MLLLGDGGSTSAVQAVSETTVLALGLPALVFGAGSSGGLLFWIVVILALATVVTVVQRVVHVARVSGTVSGAGRRRETVPTRIPATEKGVER